MAAEEANEVNMVVMKSNDDEKFKVTDLEARMSMTIKHMIQDGCVDNTIRLVNINGKISTKVAEYCKKHAGSQALATLAADADGVGIDCKASVDNNPDNTSNDELKDWVTEFVEVEMVTIFKHILVSNPCRLFPLPSSGY